MDEFSGNTRYHGAQVPRGLEAVPRSALYTGFFGRMFRHVPPLEAPDDQLERLAATMIDAGDTTGDSAIPAGYTYVGQFIDHDLTFDPTSSLQRRNDPDALHNFRTPRFDLDSLYGGGPADMPFLYESDGVRLRVQTIHDGDLDVPRVSAKDPTERRAVMGDPRNDENLIVSQLHLAFLRFHNAVAETIDGPPQERLAAAQRIVRWHYQWLVVHDFLPRITGEELIRDIFQSDPFTIGTISGQVRQAALPRLNLRFFSWRNQPFMPVEFAGAAYRFGHSMIRPAYILNDHLLQQMGKPLPVFGAGADLRGFRERPAGWTVEWFHFFATADERAERGALQHARRLVPTLAESLSRLPLIEPGSPHALAERDLKRGRALGLPSGQAVARAMGIPRDLILDAEAMGLTGDLATWFGKDTPLWYYVLAEAKVHHQGERLGPVGGRIVAEVLLGLLAGDPLSYLRLDPGWTPEAGRFGAEEAGGQPVFGMPQLLQFAGALEEPGGARMRDTLPGERQEPWSVAGSQGEPKEPVMSVRTYQPQRIANFVFPARVWKSFTAIGDDGDEKFIFLERRVINAVNGIDLRKRPGAMLYIVEPPAQGDPAGIQIDFVRKRGGYCTVYRSSTSTRERELSDDEIEPDVPVYLEPDDILFVCNAEYRMGCGDQHGTTLLMAGIDVGGDCVNRPCP